MQGEGWLVSLHQEGSGRLGMALCCVGPWALPRWEFEFEVRKEL